jgi:serine/threonine protein phosphatase PrpC
LLFPLQDIGKKRAQEDYYMSFDSVDQGLYMSGVFDGHGGSGTAHHARHHIFDYIQKGLASSKGGVVEAMKSGFTSFDRWWRDAACDPAVCPRGMDTSGSTAVVSLVQGGLLTVANAGRWGIKGSFIWSRAPAVSSPV